MKKNPFLRCLNLIAAVAAPFLLTGCFETKQEFTINPDGSGKVVHECSFQDLQLNGNEPDEDSLKAAVAKVISGSKGVEAWRDVSFKLLDDGRLFFKGTAYFTNLNTLKIPNQTMLEFDWKRTGADGVLSLRTNKSERKDGVRENEPIDLSKLPADERAKRLKVERAKYQQVKPMMTAFMGNMKHEVVFHLPGNVSFSSSFSRQPSGALTAMFDGAKVFAAMDKLVSDDEWVAKNLGSWGSADAPLMDEKANEVIFGGKEPLRATASSGQPLFDYAAEVSVAKKDFPLLWKQLDVGVPPAVVSAPARGGELKGVKVVGVRLISKTGPKNSEFRPFNYDPGYTVVLQVDFPGSILGLTDKSSIEKAIADDGTSLLDDSEWRSGIMFPKMSEDKASLLIEAELKLPAPNVKGLKELSGQLEYQTASSSKEIDLGFPTLKEGAKGTQLGAQIKSIKPGWNNDGSQETELKLNLPKDALKTVSVVANGVKAQLENSGYSGFENSYTFNLRSKMAFPADAKLVVEVYDQIQTFTASFRLENLSLLGTPLSAK